MNIKDILSFIQSNKLAYVIVATLICGLIAFMQYIISKKLDNKREEYGDERESQNKERRNSLIIFFLFLVVAAIPYVLSIYLPFQEAENYGEDYVMIRGVEYISSNSDSNTVTLSVDVAYNLGSQKNGELTIWGNYVEQDKWGGIIDGTFLIERGAGYHSFVVDIPVPRWGNFSLEAAIIPYPVSGEGWLPIIVSDEKLPFDIKSIFDHYVPLLAIPQNGCVFFDANDNSYSIYDFDTNKITYTSRELDVNLLRVELSILNEGINGMDIHIFPTVARNLTGDTYAFTPSIDHDGGAIVFYITQGEYCIDVTYQVDKNTYATFARGDIVIDHSGSYSVLLDIY